MLIRLSIAVVTAAAVFACSSSPGPDTISSHGTSAVDRNFQCTRCHASVNSPSSNPVLTNGTGTAGKHFKHVTQAHIECIVCHSGYLDSPTHMNGVLDTGNPAVLLVFFNAINPNGKWINDTGPGTGTCTSLACHGVDNLDWYGTETWTLPTCSICHGAATVNRRQVLGANGDFASNPSITSHHVTGLSDPTTTQCLVCHDLSTHMTGTITLRLADTDAGIAYDPARPSSLESFCLSCHDADGALATSVTGSSLDPFNDGSPLGNPPYPYGTRIAASWAKSFGHGSNGSHALSDRLTCLGTGQPGTGCHGSNGAINAHGSVSTILASRSFLYDTSDPFRESDYDLCFSCHSNYIGIRKEDILGVKSGGMLDTAYGWISRPADAFCPEPCWNPPYYIAGVVTRFADHNVPDLPPDYLQWSGSPYNDYGIWGTPNKNLHWFHLGFPVYFRGNTSVISGLTCVNCHDVHGSMYSSGSLYDELQYSHIFPDATNIIGQMSTTVYGTDLLEARPTYCSFNCHANQASGLPTRAWFYPIQE